MKILPIQPHNFIFTANYQCDEIKKNSNVHDFYLDPEERCFNNDAKVRDALRAHIYSRIFPQVWQEVDSSMIGATSLDDAYIPNLQKIGENAYRGASLARYKNCIPLLRKSGVFSVIDLAGNPYLKKACDNENLDYYGFDVECGFWSNPMFKDDKELLTNKKKELNKLGLSQSEIEIELENYKSDIEIGRKNFMIRFKKLIDKMNKGAFYICCDCGDYRTPNVLALNTFFNPKWGGIRTYPTDVYMYDLIKNMYNNLSMENKSDLGFTPEFEEKIKKELQIEDM